MKKVMIGLVLVVVMASIVHAEGPSKDVTQTIQKINKAFRDCDLDASVADVNSYGNTAIVLCLLNDPVGKEALKDICHAMVNAFVTDCGEHAHSVDVYNRAQRLIAEGRYTAWSGIKVELK